jgi:hypothetical protein
MVLNPSMNKPSFLFEIELKSRRHKSSCELEKIVTALESIEIVIRLEY